MGSARQCCAHSEYGRTYRVLTGYSKGTPSHGVLTGYFYSRVPTLRGALAGGCGAQRSARACSDRKGTPRVLIGCPRVLTGYSEGADRVPKGTHEVLTHNCAPRHARESLSGGCGSLCRTRRAVHGSARLPGVGRVQLGRHIRVLTGCSTVLPEYSQGTHAGPRGLCIGRSIV